MKQIVAPQETNRASAFGLWMESPMPMVTLTKSMNVTHLVRKSRHTGLKFNMLLCYCIGKAASEVAEFFMLPEKDHFARYDALAVNVIVTNSEGGINSCDIPIDNDLSRFNEAYTILTHQVAEECKSTFLDDRMVVGTSALVATEIDSSVNQYTEKFVNPFLSWGRYRKQWFRYVLPISFQFHHVQMDGMQAAQYLERLQLQIESV